MKKVMVLVMIVLTIIYGAATAELDTWDIETLTWLTNNTRDWLEENHFEEYTKLNVVENRLALGYGIVLTEDVPAYRSGFDTLRSKEMIKKLEEEYGTTVHSIDVIYMGQSGGYEIYEMIVKWNDPVTTFANGSYGEIYGFDFFVRIY